jgi:hypothetical protein
MKVFGVTHTNDLGLVWNHPVFKKRWFIKTEVVPNILIYAPVYRNWILSLT